MLLNITERLVLIEILGPQVGNAAFLRLVREFRESCSPTPEEAVAIELQATPEGYVWSREKEVAHTPSKEIEISGPIRDLILNTLRRASADETMPEPYMVIWDKFPELEPATSENHDGEAQALERTAPVKAGKGRRR
jgi:hypothetical protein